MTFRSVDIEDPENTGIVEKYGASKTQLFVTTVQGGIEVVQDMTLYILPKLDDEETVAALMRARIPESR